MPITENKLSSRFQETIETVEGLPLDEQALLIEIIGQRLIEQRRARLAEEIVEARRAYQQGKVRRGTVAELMEELKEGYSLCKITQL